MVAGSIVSSRSQELPGKVFFKGSRTLGCPAGMSVRDCLDYVNSCGKPNLRVGGAVPEPWTA